MDSNLVITIITSAVVNGAVTYGVIKATLHFLEKGIDEAKKDAARANHRIDDMMVRGGGRVPR